MTDVDVPAADTDSDNDIDGLNVEPGVGYDDGVEVGERVSGHAFTD